MLICKECLTASMLIPDSNITCPTWALPREEIPIHIKIPKNITSKLKHTKIILPDDFELIDTINLSDHHILDNMILVDGIGKADKSNYDYFGIVIASIKPFKELKKQIPINIEFIYNDGICENHVTYARIFRPRLEIETIPKNIILADTQTSEPKLPFSMKFTGFGEISIRIECRIEGKIVSIGTSVLDEIFRRIINYGIIPIDDNADDKVTVNQLYVEELVTQLKNKFHTDKDIQKMIQEQKISKEIVNMMYDFNKDDQKKFMRMFYKTVEGYLVQIISDILKRNLSNNSQIESQTAIYTDVKLPSTNVIVKFFYKDVIGNEYDPLEETFSIIDKRENPAGFNVKIPLEITKVDESDAYKNVGEMKIGTS